MIIGFDASRAFVPQRTGTENYSFELLKSLAGLDKKNQYLVYTRKNIFPFKIKSDWPSNYIFKEIPLTRLWTQLGLAFQTWVDKLDLLFVPAHTLPIFRKPFLPTLVTIHDLGYEFLPQYHNFPQKIYLNWSTVYAVKQASQIIAVSEATKKDLINKLGCQPAKIEVIYEGVDQYKWTASFSPEQTAKILKKYYLKIEAPRAEARGIFRPKSFNPSVAEITSHSSMVLKNHGILRRRNKYLLSVGTIQPRKNYYRLIQAFAKIENSGLDLVIVGKKGWMWKDILALPQKLGIEKKVKFLEYVPDAELPILYQNALCLITPSLYEGFGLPVLEAMAAHCPVIVSNTSSLPEIVADAGILIDPYNINSIIDGMNSVIKNPITRENLIVKGIDRIKHFSWELTARKTLAIFEKISQ